MFGLLGFASLAYAHGDAHGELIIRMTKNGFEPKELTITAGDEVLFINNDDTNRWPASNFHPTHTLYSEFDSQKDIPPGESWKFKFEKAGTWRMHDHLIPHMTGTVMVLTDSTKGQTLNTNSQGLTLENSGFWAKIKTFLSRLFRGSKTSTISEFKSLSEQGKYAWLEDLSRREGPETAWQLVLETYNTPEGVIGSPHDMAHLVGQLLYKSEGFKGLSTCTPVFAFGCYHGLMEIAFEKDSNAQYQNNLTKAELGCQNVGPETSPTYWSCIHGIGHGIATFREHDLKKALPDCNLLAETIRTYCQDGIFMEFSISAPESFYKKTDPIYPCNAISESYKVACARSQVQVMRLRLGMNTTQIAESCIKTGNQNITYHCIDALGYFIGQVAEGDASKIVQSCQEIKDESSAAQCTSAAAGELVFQNAVGWKGSVKQICESLSGEFRNKCEERVASVKKSYGRE